MGSRAGEVDFDEDAEDISVEEARRGVAARSAEEMPGPKRAVHGRKATAFVPKKAMSNARKPEKRRENHATKAFGEDKGLFE